MKQGSKVWLFIAAGLFVFIIIITAFQISAARKEGYEEGYEEGYAKGYEIGYYDAESGY